MSEKYGQEKPGAGFIHRRIVAGVFSVAMFCIAASAADRSDGVLAQVPAGQAVNYRDIEITEPYLLLPIQARAEREWMQFYVDGRRVRDFSVEYNAESPDFWMPADVREFVGKTLTIQFDAASPGALEAIRQVSSFPSPESLYREKYRPGFHFTSKWGRLNDPNGLVYFEGEYHLFYQHVPFAINSGGKHWGHAVSSDLVHWEELPTALHPDELGHIFSGSAVIDYRNTAGFQVGDEPAMVAIYTSAPGVQGHSWSSGRRRTQSIAYSNDRGRTFTKYEDNPVVPHIRANNRDPKVFWHEETGRWVMFLYLQRPNFAFLSSPDLKTWTFESELAINDGHECPEIFQLPVNGDPERVQWIVWEGAGRYFIGDFDGSKFEAKHGPFVAVHGANDYAAQNFNNLPNGRVVQISWMGGGCDYPEMPFNQQMTVARELSLRETEDGPRLFINPVPELKGLRETHHGYSGLVLDNETVEIEGIATGLLDIELKIMPEGAQEVTLHIFGEPISYNVEKSELTALNRNIPLDLLSDGSIALRILLDRTSIEIFANHGRKQMAFCLLPDTGQEILTLESREGEAVVDLDVWELRSIWEE